MRRLLTYAAIGLCAPLILGSGSASARNYDCAKAGNANKAACKSTVTAAAPAPTAKPAAQAAAARNYDCTKAGNANKAACKSAVTAAAPAPMAKPAAQASAAAKPAAAATPRMAPAAQAGQNTAVCKDGSYSKSLHRSGTCANHGGVANWLVKVS
ncbi:DUF3761 domain-containing protein [Phenylobacterium sp.]|uniref:DUF3761 domain-containing protein n=1 Tax=Phenylobacterium sp. TaxID=1871053 RepID=UPI002F3F4F36